MKQPQELIEVLLDITVPEADRDDAAMDLATYDNPEVEDALIRAGVELSTPGAVAASCGESLAEIWMRKGQLHPTALKLLRSEARNEAVALIRVREPSSTWEI